MNIEQLLQQHRGAVKRLFRRYSVIGDVSMETVEKGFHKKGERFMLDLLAILVPDDSGFTNLLTSSAITGAETLSYLQNQPVTEMELEKAVSEGGKFWSFWDKLLNRVDNTGKTIGQFRIDSSGFPQYSQFAGANYQYQPAPVDNRKVIFGGALFLVIVVMLLLIFKK